MKKAHLFPVILLSLLMMASCSKKGVDINIDDPQDIEFLQIIDTALLNAFGEEHIHFGHTPPNIEGLSFLVDSMEYVVCNRYKYHPITHEIILSTYNGPEDYDPSKYYHLFQHHHLNLSSHTLLSIGSGGADDTYKRYNDKVFIIGTGQKFTAYYEEKPSMPYRPTFGILISGELVNDDQGHPVGIKNYRYGKMYMEYQDQIPYNANVYLVNSVEVKKHLRTIAPCFDPDTCTIWKQFN